MMGDGREAGEDWVSIEKKNNEVVSPGGEGRGRCSIFCMKLKECGVLVAWMLWIILCPKSYKNVVT